MKEFDRDIIITMRHIRASKMCSGGARAFFKSNDLDWDKFLKQGISCGEIIDLDDEMGLQVVRIAHG